MGFFDLWKRKERIYLDHAAATPVAEKILTEMAPYFSVHFGNPSAVHAEGLAARDAVERARERVARTLGIKSRGVIFTGHGTESNNLAIHGVIEARRNAGVAYGDMRVISTAIEHPSITEPLAAFRTGGVDVVLNPVDADGHIDLDAFSAALNKDTVLVTIGYANSEIGTLQDIARITRTVRAFNETHGASVTVHVDAAQAPLWLPIRLPDLGVDLMSLDAGKCCGPKGVGVLARHGKIELERMMRGGGQEFGLRAGTENTPLVVGCAAALERAADGRESRSTAVAALRDRMIDAVLDGIDGTILNGSRDHRIANNVNISIPGLDSEFAVVTLDGRGVAASTKSACEGAKSGGSEVVRAISGDEERARSTIRFTLGEETSMREISAAVRVLKEHVLKTRRNK